MRSRTAEKNNENHLPKLRGAGCYEVRVRLAEYLDVRRAVVKMAIMRAMCRELRMSKLQEADLPKRYSMRISKVQPAQTLLDANI